MNFALSFTQEQLAIIDRALSSRPYGEVAALINEINQQIATQQQAAPEAGET